ncbi:conserved hypothetical protein [Pyrenophora tritici-repentis Pt-1C-BFP]|uniref:Uncharacterized protein n=1 Tax=Pyrenophora tritici-repentis (strain Pt-1C-BFP) TaxID=426418 RepID=B2WLD8_PYRTR|nr:uncharacterized protein PTRG_10798 [Pyrenophora tritici-repentis Pt-1C-BFP]EDU43848.1 conserved hypothetical protein [Pyrenophora tritici-repentis Pt-1C-BFP]
MTVEDVECRVGIDLGAWIQIQPEWQAKSTNPIHPLAMTENKPHENTSTKNSSGNINDPLVGIQELYAWLNEVFNWRPIFDWDCFLRTDSDSVDDNNNNNPIAEIAKHFQYLREARIPVHVILGRRPPGQSSLYWGWPYNADEWETSLTTPFDTGLKPVAAYIDTLSIFYDLRNPLDQNCLEVIEMRQPYEGPDASCPRPVCPWGDNNDCPFQLQWNSRPPCATKLNAQNTANKQPIAKMCYLPLASNLPPYPPTGEYRSDHPEANCAASETLHQLSIRAANDREALGWQRFWAACAPRLTNLTELNKKYLPIAQKEVIELTRGAYDVDEPNEGQSGKGQKKNGVDLVNLEQYQTSLADQNAAVEKKKADEAKKTAEAKKAQIQADEAKRLAEQKAKLVKRVAGQKAASEKAAKEKRAAEIQKAVESLKAAEEREAAAREKAEEEKKAIEAQSAEAEEAKARAVEAARLAKVAADKARKEEEARKEAARIAEAARVEAEAEAARLEAKRIKAARNNGKGGEDPTSTPTDPTSDIIPTIEGPQGSTPEGSPSGANGGDESDRESSIEEVPQPPPKKPARKQPVRTPHPPAPAPPPQIVATTRSGRQVIRPRDLTRTPTPLYGGGSEDGTSEDSSGEERKNKKKTKKGKEPNSADSYKPSKKRKADDSDDDDCKKKAKRKPTKKPVKKKVKKVGKGR